MSNKSILFLTRFRPDIMDGGGALRNGQNIYGLSLLGKLDLIYIGTEKKINPLPYLNACEAFTIDSSGKKAHGVLHKILQNVKIFLGGNYPQFSGYYVPDVVKWILRREASGLIYDYVVVEELALAYYIPHLKRIGRTVVFDAHNVEGILRSQMESAKTDWSRYIGFGAFKRFVLRRNLEKLESRAVNTADLVWACSDLDKELLLNAYGAAIKCFAVPNTINVDNYLYKTRELETGSWADKPLAIVYMGSYSYLPNSVAALTLMTEVMPILRNKSNGVKLYLVGRSPTPDMVAYAQSHHDIVITGSVDSIEPYLSMACVLAMPIGLGSGTRLKVLEGFAARRPIVSTSKGAEGLEIEDGANIIIREEPAQIAQAILDLWQNTDLRARICDSGFCLVKDRYSWHSAAQSIHDSLSPFAEIPQ
jgi:glycosyltransferase involved in cell wall biosynthesis